ncbi:MAG: toxin-antitoxin (TA) system antitoxin [bacterium]|nr:toxin-antitoxin (TA) system antitoxin [bacterium]
MTKTIDIQSPQMNFNDVVSLVRKGAEIVLTDASIPFARMIPVSSSSSARTPGLHAGAIHTSDDFDEPLPDEFWMGQA